MPESGIPAVARRRPYSASWGFKPKPAKPGLRGSCAAGPDNCRVAAGQPFCLVNQMKRASQRYVVSCERCECRVNRGPYESRSRRAAHGGGSGYVALTPCGVGHDHVRLHYVFQPFASLRLRRASGARFVFYYWLSEGLIRKRCPPWEGNGLSSVCHEVASSTALAVRTGQCGFTFSTVPRSAITTV